MRKSWLVLLVALIAVASVGSAPAKQEVLDSLINVALKSNPDLSAANFAEQASAHTARSAGALPDPQVTVGILNLPNNSFALDQTPMTGVALGFSQQVPWPGKLSARSDLANTRYRQSESVAAIVESRIVREVTNAYLEYSHWSLSQPIIEDYLQLLKATRESAEIRYANGKGSAQDVLRASTMLSRAEIRLLKFEQGRQSSLLDLQRAVGVPTIFDKLPPILAEPDDSDTVTQSIEDNPMLSDATLAVEGARIQQRLAQHTYRPDFTVGVDYRLRKDIPTDPVRGTDFLTFKVGLNLPLWFFSKQKHDVRAARHMTRVSMERERSVRELLTTRLGDAQSQLTMVLASLRRYDESILPETEAAAKAARVAYEVGDVDFNALLAAQSDAFEVQLERLDLLRQYHQTIAALNELAGISQER